MNLLKDERLTLHFESAVPSFSRYVGSNERFIKFLAKPNFIPIILPNGKYFSADEEADISGREKAFGEIKVILKERELQDIELAGELIASPDDLEFTIVVNQRQMDSIFSLIANGRLPETLICYVRNAKTDDPNYKALNLKNSSYQLSDWDISFLPIKKLIS